MPMALRVDRPGLPMGLCQLKIRRRNYENRKVGFIDNDFIKMYYLEEV